MNGEFIGIWPDTWREIWEPLASLEIAPEDLFCELYRELSPALRNKPTIEELADIIDNPDQSQNTFKNIKAEDLAGERVLINFFEKTYENLNDLAGDKIANPYFALLENFIRKFNLRYDLRRPCTLCPTLTGVFASLVHDLQIITNQDIHLNRSMKNFEEAIRDLRYGCTDGRITTCIHKQIMLLEALGATCPGVNKKTLSEMCEQVKVWPHMGVKESLKNLYGATSDYPGIRHDSNVKGMIRNVDMRDMVAMSILLSGFIPYLCNQLDADNIYRRT